MDDLLGPVPASTKKSKKTPAEVDGVVARLEAVFVTAHEARWNCKPLLTPYGRNRKHLKDLASQLSEAEVADLIARFFETTDPQVVRSDYSIAAFFRLAQHLRIRSTGAPAPLDERVAGNVAAARRATGRKP